MELLERAGINWLMSKICKAAKIKGGVTSLPAILYWHACYQYILGECKDNCPLNCDHLDKSKLPEDKVKDLCSMVALGVAALCKAAGAGVLSALKKNKKK